jgi:peptidoglycan/xylan/chitin deacetylase (PgdA/CDA1 family)
VRWVAARNPEVLFYVNTKAQAVALTIDDSPHAVVTPKILDVLKENSARATFFLIGDHMKGNEPLLDRMRSEGHELGHHMARDYPSILLPADQFERELVEVDQMIKPQGPIKWLRPASGWYNKRMLGQIKAHGYRCSLGSVYPYDVYVRNTWILSTYITKKVFPGAIIIIHDGSKERLRTVDVLKSVLPVLIKDKGYKVVTLSELISMKEQ